MAADGRTVSFLDNPTMLNLDPPDHSRLRKLANHGFVHKSILSLEPGIVELVDQLLDDIDIAGDQFDIVEVLTKPLPVIVIAELLGLPKEDVPRFQELSHRFVGLTAIGNNELMNVGARAASELHDYFADVIASKRQTPGDDLISNLIEVEEEGDRLTNEELNSTCMVLLIAGPETTTLLIGYGIHLCLGMTLARLESKVAFERLLSRFGRLDLAEQKIEFTPVPLNRGRQKLLINVG
jgi:cytochrome P450